MKEFNCTHCGECCGPVPVSRSELEGLKAAIKKMPNRHINRLRSQKRGQLQCILWDTKTKSCSVYEDRPMSCKMFGFYQGMVCPDNPSHATKSFGEGHKKLKDTQGNLAGVLTLQIGWEELLKC